LGIEDKKVMVLGGGIAGLTAAWELSRAGVAVELVEKADFLGGHAIQYACKATDTCQQCGACAVESTLKKVVGAQNINVHLAKEVSAISQQDGFSVSFKATDAANKAASKAVCEGAYAENPEGCAAGRGWSKHNAVFYSEKGELDSAKVDSADKIKVDAVVVATGFTPFDANIKSTYRYDELANVITGLDLERAKRTNGGLVRPSDGQAPEKIAFIQCVGSRDERLGNLWCSQVCCPYALRSAMAAKHQNPELDVTIFYMDIQNTTNNFPRFYQQCKEGFRFVRNIPVDMYEADGGRVRTRFMTEGDEAVEDEFDLVVLSVGIMPGEGNKALAETLDLTLGGDGFIQGTKLDGAHSGSEGIFLAGTVTGPRTIAGSMAQAGQSACDVIKYLEGAS
jgi:heterodisulfide reductase subunit A